MAKVITTVAMRMSALLLLSSLLCLPSFTVSAMSAHLTQASGELYGAGHDAQGQLGDGSDNSYGPVPPVKFQLPAGRSIKSVHFAHTDAYADVYVIADNNRVYSVGENTAGQLGDGTYIDNSDVVEMQLPAGVEAASVESDGYAAYVLTTVGEVYFTGSDPTPGLIAGPTYKTNIPLKLTLPVGTYATKISASQYNFLILLNNGQVLSGGSNTYGQLGNGTFTSAALVTYNLPGGALGEYLYTDYRRTYVITTDGRVFGAGYNVNGQLGNGLTVNSSTPVQFQLPVGAVAKSVQYLHGDSTVYVVTTDGRVFGAGRNDYGQLATGSTATSVSTPVQLVIPGGAVASKLESDYYSTHILTSDGRVFASGRNTSGELGIGSQINALTIQEVILPAGVRAVGLGRTNFYHAFRFIIGDDGRVYGSGANSSGQLGDGTTTLRSTPVEMLLPAEVDAAETWSSDDGVHIRTTDGRVYATGSNYSSWLGVTSSTNSISTPIQLTFPAGFVATDLLMGFDSKFILGTSTVAPSTPPSSPTTPSADLSVAANTDSTGLSNTGSAQNIFVLAAILILGLSAVSVRRLFRWSR